MFVCFFNPNNVGHGLKYCVTDQPLYLFSHCTLINPKPLDELTTKELLTPKYCIKCVNVDEPKLNKDAESFGKKTT